VNGRNALEELDLLDAYWRAANYLSAGQIYLRDNPLLTEPLGLENISTAFQSWRPWRLTRSRGCATR